jgi:hypothetical protein
VRQFVGKLFADMTRLSPDPALDAPRCRDVAAGGCPDAFDEIVWRTARLCRVSQLKSGSRNQLQARNLREAAAKVTRQKQN